MIVCEDLDLREHIFLASWVMADEKKLINKAFILAGGKGKRIQLSRMQNLKAFIEINNEQLLVRHIRQIQEYLAPKDTYVVITEYENLFREVIKSFKGVHLIFNEKLEKVDGLELLFAVRKINAHLKNDEKALITLVDEYYDDNDFREFCHNLFGLEFSTIAAIKELTFPEEYLKNYAVVTDDKNKTISKSVEKSKTIISKHFGTGLICIDKAFAQQIEKNLLEGIKTPLFSLLGHSNVSRYYVLKNYYCNINTRVDIYELEKKIRQNKNFTIDVVIPAYLEEETISFVVHDFKDHVNQVIVANKKSTDNTESVANESGAKVFSDHFRGYGHALKTGIAQSKADIIVLAEADGTFRSSDLKKMIFCLMDNDLVQGTRTNPSYIQYKANMNRPRIFFNKLFASLVSFLWQNNKTSISDVGCTFRAFWREKYVRIEKNLIADGAPFAPELTIEFINNGYRVIEIPVNYYPRLYGTSKFSDTYLKVSITALKMLRLIILKRILYFFNKN